MTDPLAAVRRLRRMPSEPRPRAGETCEICREAVGPEHNHLVDLERRTLMCACRLCWLLFAPEGAGGGHYKAVPERYVAFPDLELSHGEWDALQIPVSVAFFFLNSSIDRVAAFYPGPPAQRNHSCRWTRGTSSRWRTPSWPRSSRTSRRSWCGPTRGAPSTECFLVPIDACYELVGRLRTLWRGFDGGREANEALEEFFAGIRARAS